MADDANLVRRAPRTWWTLWHPSGTSTWGAHRASQDSSSSDDEDEASAEQHQRGISDKEGDAGSRRQVLPWTGQSGCRQLQARHASAATGGQAGSRPPASHCRLTARVRPDGSAGRRPHSARQPDSLKLPGSACCCCNSAQHGALVAQGGRADAVRVRAVPDGDEGGFADFQSAFSSSTAQVGLRRPQQGHTRGRQCYKPRAPPLRESGAAAAHARQIQ